MYVQSRLNIHHPSIEGVGFVLCMQQMWNFCFYSHVSFFDAITPMTSFKVASFSIYTSTMYARKENIILK